VSAAPHGASFRTRTARVNVLHQGDTPHSYFLKVARGDVGMGMIRGEFEGITALYEVARDFVPRPVGWGTYISDSNTHFYLGDFIDMIEELPDIQKFCARLAKLHKDSIPFSKNGKFGFHTVTYEGSMHQDVTWCDTWEELFIRAIKTFADQERHVHGPSKDLDHLLPALYEKVCPRLLRVLETGGRMIKPVLVHGNLWYGNIATNAETGEPVIFDPAVFWAHNECK
jgi:protein-ribulosamine 3-kinase